MLHGLFEPEPTVNLKKEDCNNNYTLLHAPCSHTHTLFPSFPHTHACMQALAALRGLRMHTVRVC